MLLDFEVADGNDKKNKIKNGGRRRGDIENNLRLF